MTIIAVTLNKSGSLTLLADKLVGSNRRWIGERSKISTLHVDKAVDIAFAGSVYELDHEELFNYVHDKFNKVHTGGGAKFVTRVVTEYLNSKERKPDICALVTDGRDACSIDLDKFEGKSLFVPAFSSIKPSRGDLAWIELTVSEVNSHTNSYGYAETEELFSSIILLHKLAGYPNVLPSVGEN